MHVSRTAIFLSGVSKRRLFVIYWLPVIVCMAVIFGGSGDTLSVQHTSRIIGPLLHWLFPNINPELADRIILFVRKCGHLSEFGLLALLLWRALVKPALHRPLGWHWADARLAFLLAVLYASSDEFHQCFVPSREGAVRDVIVDTIGATAALFLLWFVGRWRKWWQTDPPVAS